MLEAAAPRPSRACAPGSSRRSPRIRCRRRSARARGAPAGTPGPEPSGTPRRSDLQRHPALPRRAGRAGASRTRARSRSRRPAAGGRASRERIARRSSGGVAARAGRRERAPAAAPRSARRAPPGAELVAARDQPRRCPARRSSRRRARRRRTARAPSHWARRARRAPGGAGRPPALSSRRTALSLSSTSVTTLGVVVPADEQPAGRPRPRGNDRQAPAQQQRVDDGHAAGADREQIDRPAAERHPPACTSRTSGPSASARAAR